LGSRPKVQAHDLVHDGVLIIVALFSNVLLNSLTADRKVDINLPGNGDSNSHGAKPVYENHHDDRVDSDQ